MLLLLASADVFTAERQAAYRVLVLHSFRGSLPINNDWHTGLVRGFTSDPSRRIEIDIEAPDLSRFDDAHYLGNLLNIYRRKYGDDPPDLIVPTFTPALAFLLRHGEELFPGVPVVFCDVEAPFVERTPLPPRMTGVTSLVDVAGTLELALSVHPDARNVAVIGGAGGIDRQFLSIARRELGRFEQRVELTWMDGVPVDDMIASLTEMPADTIILFLSYLQDRTGAAEVPMDVTRRLSGSVPFPIYGLWDTLLGHGVLGGRMITLAADAEQAARMGLRILAGEDPSAIPIRDRTSNAAIFDDRAIRRLGIDRRRLPAGSETRFRQPTAWENYATEISLAVALILLQTTLIIALTASRARLRRAQAALEDQSERRREAESLAAGLRERMSRFSRQRSLGTMATTIAHEINQPLIAIQNYAQAASRRLEDAPEQAESLARLIGKIEQQAGRAGDITRRVRSIVRADPPHRQAVRLRPLLDESVALVETELASVPCRVAVDCPASLPDVQADSAQIQLVLVNLLRNAARAMSETAVEQPVIGLAARREADQRVRVEVSDRGPGVPDSRIEDLFEPLAIASPGGMGMGLAICREIVEAHGGRIWHEPNPPSGARFVFTLEAAGP